MAESSTKRARRQQVRFLPAHILLILGGLVMVFPFLWQLLMSISTNAQIQAVPPRFFPDPVPVASKKALRSNSSNSPWFATAISSSGIW